MFSEEEDGVVEHPSQLLDQTVNTNTYKDTSFLNPLNQGDDSKIVSPKEKESYYPKN